MNVLNTLLLIPFLCRYHPLYITDSQEGGLGQKTGLDARKQTAYAGVEYDEDGNAIPIGGKYDLHSLKISKYIYPVRFLSWSLLRVGAPHRGSLVGDCHLRGIQGDIGLQL